MRIARPDDPTDLTSLGLTLADGKRLLAGVQREVVATQARAHAVHRPACRGCGVACRGKRLPPARDRHAVRPGRRPAAPLPLCGVCHERARRGMAAARPLDPGAGRLQAQLSALMTCRTAAEVPAQLFPVDTGSDPETLGHQTFRIAEALPMRAETGPPSAGAEAIVVTLDSTSSRSCEANGRRLEVRIGNIETATGERQVFGAVAGTDTDPAPLIRRGLDAVGCTASTAVAAFTGGCPGPRSILLKGGVDGPLTLDCFHLAMRLQHLR